MVNERVNPNLYVDGKVCLSLLGTWHGVHASEHWDAEKSSVFQIAISIQSLILNMEPYFNEAGFDVSRGSEFGTESSRVYNETIIIAVAQSMLSLLSKQRKIVRKVEDRLEMSGRDFDSDVEQAGQVKMSDGERADSIITVFSSEINTHFSKNLPK
ncbi:unnamed protein product [Protopolystoma xenopodis]|uniref:UBC core domain-containing protein n=1 Tax=Protopolystoma xenopodis TaxID=117903 RepID=A0A3S5CPH5_9PLAT|nr:unnamed protein product [Protopolystoma xenopodis]